MAMKIYFLFILFPIVFSVNDNNRFCSIQRCPPGQHTLCLYPREEPHRRCQRVIRSGLTEDEKDWILYVHNYYRNVVYNGNELRGRPGTQPTATQDLELEWDNDLARTAQRWVDQCKLFNEKCRNMDEYIVGQNYVLDDYDEDMDSDMELRYLQELVIYRWYNEVERYNWNHVRKFKKAEGIASQTLNYTQMVWGNTEKVGCGAIRYYQSTFIVPKIFLACNYGPSGNIENEPVYEIWE